MRRIRSLVIVSLATLPQLEAQDPVVPATQSAVPSNAALPSNATPAKVQEAPKGLQWTSGDYTIKLGGYVKVDLIHDFDEIGSTDSFDPRTIPVGPGVEDGTNTRMHARQTRLNLDLSGPTSGGPMRVFVEGDFFGDGNAFRLRHAYGTLGSLLAGQTWSTFMDPDAMPETLDFESPIAFPQIRQAMIRYTHDLGDGNYAAIALEDPASKVIPPAAAGTVEEPTPDLTARLRWEHGLGHTQLGLFAGTARYNQTAGPNDTVGLFGLNLSTRLDVFEHDAIFVQATYGPGVGRYRGGVTAAPDASGNLEAVEVFGAMLAYEHHFSDEWRSTVTYSWGKGDIPGGSPADTTEILQYFAANLIWQFNSKAWTGIEYLYGARETMDDNDGDAQRVQFSVRFSF